MREITAAWGPHSSRPRGADLGWRDSGVWTRGRGGGVTRVFLQQKGGVGGAMMSLWISSKPCPQQEATLTGLAFAPLLAASQHPRHLSSTYSRRELSRSLNPSGTS